MGKSEVTFPTVDGHRNCEPNAAQAPFDSIASDEPAAVAGQRFGKLRHVALRLRASYRAARPLRPCLRPDARHCRRLPRVPTRVFRYSDGSLARPADRSSGTVRAACTRGGGVTSPHVSGPLLGVGEGKRQRERGSPGTDPAGAKRHCPSGFRTALAGPQHTCRENLSCSSQIVVRERRSSQRSK